MDRPFEISIASLLVIAELVGEGCARLRLRTNASIVRYTRRGFMFVNAELSVMTVLYLTALGGILRLAELVDF